MSPLRRRCALGRLAALASPMVGSLAALGLTGCAAGGAAAARPTLVLVHGAWHGGWCWDRTRDALARRQLDSVAPTLAGLGERAGELGPGIDLETHIGDVLAVLDGTRGPVVLVGHSYGGFVVTGAAARWADARRLQGLVYLDAFVPRAGERVADSMEPQAVARLEARFREGDARYPAVPSKFFGVDAADQPWVDAKLTAQPAGTYLQALASATLPGHARRIYIACTRPALPVFERTRRRIAGDPGWRFVELATGHDAMIAAPEPLADLLQAAAVPA